MLDSLPMIFMQYISFRDVIDQLAFFGLFDVILPFLLIFAVVFGVLGWTGIFGDSKAIHVMIALVIGLLAIRWPIYTDFLNIISPKLAIGLVILLVLITLIGLFTPENSKQILGWILIGIGFIIFLVILAQTYSVLSYGYGFGPFNETLIACLLMVGLLIGIIVAVVVGGTAKPKSPGEKAIQSLAGIFKRPHS